MEIVNLINTTDRNVLRQWLLDNHNQESCCWVVVKSKPDQGALYYIDIVEEALCFGWIDSTKKRISDTETAQRLSPRRKGSKWTELNLERVRRMEKLGLMHHSGHAVLPDMNAFAIHPDIMMRIKDDPKVLKHFKELPDLYVRVRIDNIQGYYIAGDLDTYEKRMTKFLDNTRNNILYGSWHDNGRLLDY